MSTSLVEHEVRPLVENVVTAPDDASRTTAISVLVSSLHDAKVLEVWARSLARQYGMGDDWEETLQVISEALITYMRDITIEDFEKVSRLASHLYYRARAALTRWLDSPAVTVASEMSNVSRKYRRALVARREYVEKHGKEPTPAELVDAMNEKARRTRSNPEKQGAIVTEQDVTGMMLHSYSLQSKRRGSHTPEVEFGDSLPGSASEDVEAPGELAVTVRMLGDLAEHLHGEVDNPSVKEVLGAWMELIVDGEPPTITAVAMQLGIGRTVARDRVSRIEDVLKAFRESHSTNEMPPPGGDQEGQ